MKAVDDGKLFERWLECQDGDAFAELARRHAPVVYDLAVRASGDPVMAEDLVQEALLDLALTRTRKPLQVGVVAWMARFAICRGRNQRSSEASRARRQRIVGGRRREEVMPDDRLERSEELERALARAEPDERVVLAMRYLHGWDYARIGRALDLTEGAARVRLHRALRNVRTRLGVGSAAAPANGDATEPGTNGRETNGKLLGALAVLPVHRMPAGLLDLGIEHAVEIATAQLAAGAASGGAAAPTSRLPRLTLEALGLATLVAAAASASLPAERPHAATTNGGVVETAAEITAGVAAVRTPREAAATPRVGDGGAVPRPPDWTDGALEGLLPGGEHRTPARKDSRTAVRPDARSAGAAEDAAPAEPERAAGHGTPAPLAARGPEVAEMLRPTPRSACAATCDSVSSEDERAGIFGPSSVPPPIEPPVEAPVEPPAGTSDGAPSADAHATAPGLPARLRHDPRRALDRARRAPVKPLDELDPEQRELIEHAAGLVKELVDPDTAAAGGAAVVTRRSLKRQKRRVVKAYRRMRRRLAAAALAGDPDAVAAHTQRAAKLSTANLVLRFLLDVARAPEDGVGRVGWPDGAGFTAALEDVVLTLTLEAERVAEAEAGAQADALPDGVFEEQF